MSTTDQSSIDAVAASIIDVPVEAAQEVVEQEAVEQEEVVDTAAAEEVAEPAAEEVTDDTAEAVDEVADEYDEQETTDEVEEHEEPLYTVTVDGKARHVPLDELRRGYSGQAHINQTLENLAAVKKEMQRQYQELQSGMEFITDFRRKAEQGEVLVAPTPPDRNLFKTDPIGYMEAKLQFDEQTEAYQQQEQKLHMLTQQRDAEQERNRQTYLQQELTALQEAIPELADPKTAPAYRDRMVNAGVNFYGFSPEEVHAEPDSRKIRLLNDAMRWRELQESKGAARQKSEGARPVVRPGAKKSAKAGAVKRVEKAKSRMRQSGSVDDVAAYLLS